ncbi:MAG TPA: M15 family metallopeptidase [Candidatus Saccharimonadales bacterium]|nr:M15 family metallopeptidase [Candidatus Saccharimonadales bacterium]
MPKTKTKIDSKLTTSQALAQNPDMPCPDEVLHGLGLMEVEYLGFDGKIHQSQMVVSTEVMAEVEAFFKNALELKFPIEKVIPASAPDYKWDDAKLMADNVTSCFNYRVVAGTNKLSNHALGRAFDVNPVQNPCLRYDLHREKNEKIVRPPKSKWNASAPGTLYAEHPLVKLMEGFGWEWGGNWTRESGIIDYQHLEKPA